MYQESIRSRQIERAKKHLKHPSSVDRRSKTDAKRFIKKTPYTGDGEIADKAVYEIDMDAISEESRYDGFYAVCTNLDDDPADIAKINHDRWEIEESFRIMKSEFEARPVYLQKNDNYNLPLYCEVSPSYQIGYFFFCFFSSSSISLIISSLSGVRALINSLSNLYQSLNL